MGKSKFKTNKEVKKTNIHQASLNNRNFVGIEFLWIVIIVITTFLTYFNSLKNGILSWDDAKYITDNPYIKSLTFQNVKSIFTNFYFANYHPITTLSWAIELKLFGNSIFHFHFINLLIHIFNACLVYYFTKLLIKRLDISVIVALLFAVHPMHVESVAWISERKDVLYAFFYLSSMIMYVHYINKSNHLRFYFYSLLLFIGSLLSKSMSVTLPIVLFLIDYFYNRKLNKNLIFEKIPFILLSIITGILAIKSQTIAGENMYVPIFNLIDRFFLVSYATCFYLFKAVFPIHLSSLHPYPLKIGTFLPFIYYLSFAFLVIIAWMIYKSKRNKKELIFGILFFLISISIVLQIMPVGQANVAERYTYLPYWGLFFILGVFYVNLSENKFFQKKTNKFILIIGISFIIILYAIQSNHRNTIWKNNKTLFADVIKKYPQNYYGYFVLANAAFDEQDYETAYRLYNTALQFNNKEKVLFNNLGYVKTKMKDLNGALNDFNQAIQLDNNYASPYNNRGNLKIDIKDFKGAILDFDKAIELDAENWLNYYNRAVAKTNANDNDGAIKDYTKAIDLNPDFAMTYNNRALIKSKLQDFKGAIDDYNKAISIDPNNTFILLNRGITKISFKDFEGAINDFSRIINLEPNNYNAFLNRGNAKLNLSQFSDAIKDYNLVLALNPNNAAAYFNIGMCNMQLNIPNEACKNLKKALDLGAFQANDVIKNYCK